MFIYIYSLLGVKGVEQDLIIIGCLWLTWNLLIETQYEIINMIEKYTYTLTTHTLI